MELPVARNRTVETENQRKLRLKDSAQKRAEEAEASDEAMDEMVRRSIDGYGA